MENQELIAIGYIKTSYGVRGYFKVASYSGETEHFYKLRTVWLKRQGVTRQFAVENVTEKSGDILLKLKGIDTPEAAKMFSTWDVTVPREFASPLQEGEFYFCDLFGSTLLHEGKEMGVVKSVIDSGASHLLEIECEKGIVLVPFLDRFIGEVDTKSKTIELKETWFFE